MIAAATRREVLDAILTDLGGALPAALGANCLGVYFTGSAGAGTLHPTVQDVDLLYLTDTPAAPAELIACRAALQDVAARHTCARVRVAWHVVSGPWKPAPDSERWTVALHGNLMSRRQLAKLAVHHANIAATMFAAGRVLAGADPAALCPAGAVTPALQLQHVFGVRWLRELLFSVAACTLDAPALEPVLAEVLQYTLLSGAKNMALLEARPDPLHLPVVERTRAWKASGSAHVCPALLTDAAVTLAAFADALEEYPDE